MLHEEKKTAKIVEELTMFFFGIGGSEMSSSIKRIDDEKIKISFKSNYDEMLAYKLDYMENFLMGQKNDGVADIYWELIGSGDPGETSQLLLLGMMIDKATVSREEGYVTIEMEKYLVQG